MNVTLSRGSDIVIVGGGVVGCATAYYLAKEGIRATIVERDTLAGHASGFALGGLLPLGGAGIPGPLETLSLESYRLHRQLAEALPQETGIDTEFQQHAGLMVAYTEEEAEILRSRLPWQQAQQDFRLEWKSGEDILGLEPRLAPGVVGGVVIQHVGMVNPYKFALALLQAAESRGATMRHGVVRGLSFQGDRIQAVHLANERIPCQGLVLAMGPWASAAAQWLGLDIPMEPLKGQLLRLRVGGQPLSYTAWGHSYAVTKPDDLVWVGTTEERVDFDERPSLEGKQHIIESALRALPYLGAAEVIYHTACLRPITPDGLPFLGPVPGKVGVFIATGGGRKGIHLGPIMGHITAELIAHDKARFDFTALALGRSFPPTTVAAADSDPFRF